MSSSTPAPSLTGHPAVLALSVCGRRWELERPADLETLWEQMDVLNEDERIPYWTEIWPASLALAEWLRARQAQIQGRRALDLGCGIGLTALAGSWLGARVIGMDYEAEALRYAQKNAARNQVPPPDWTVMDWRAPALAPRSLPFIWAGDVMYETRFAQPILNFLDYSLADRGVAWIAEPCRAVYDVFRTTLVNRRWGCRCVLETRVAAVIPQPKPVPVRIWEITR